MNSLQGNYHKRAIIPRNVILRLRQSSRSRVSRVTKQMSADDLVSRVVICRIGQRTRCVGKGGRGHSWDGRGFSEIIEHTSAFRSADVSSSLNNRFEDDVTVGRCIEPLRGKVQHN